MKRFYPFMLALVLTVNSYVSVAQTEEFQEPWKDNSTAIVIDAFEGNAIDWDKLATDDRVAAVIHRASIGYRKDKQYFQRRILAKKHGYKWGSYHVGKRGNPIKQADFYLRSARPAKDEVMVLDLEDVESGKFMNIAQARLFIKRIKQKTGRYPMVYGNYKVITKISTMIGKDDLFSQTPLWYARFRNLLPDFPKGTWQTYTLWQFSCEINCKPTQQDLCPYLVPGTETDIDVNVYNGTVDNLRKSWPFN
ncbi:MAG: glycoside hydrolase family 25 protein [Acidobacteriota bacterium]